MDSCLKCPVTAIKLTNNILLTGQGSKLVIYQLHDSSKLLSLKIFNSSRIHKFIECQHNPGKWLILGGKSVRCIKLETERDKCNVTFVCREETFHAWLWDGYWLNDESLLLISAHNTVLHWIPSTNHSALVSSCIQQCILYSATITLINDEPVVAAGTVFNHVLLWKPEYKQNSEHGYKDIYKTFVGHEGVIFRVRFHPSLPQMLSVSDDRSIRLWSIMEESCLQVLYGHSARVWDAQYISNHIVSIGEDALCILWNLSGNIVKKYSGHKGKSIWSLDVNDDVIVSGGGDGAIRIWNMKTELLEMKGDPLEIVLPEEDIILHENNCKDYPRTVKWINQSFLIAFSNNGTLWSYSVHSSSWTSLYQDERFSSYCCLDVFSTFVAIGNLKGVVRVLSIENPDLYCEETIFIGKVFSIFWLSLNTQQFLLVCGPEGEIKVLTVHLMQNKISLDVAYLFTCPYSRQRWIPAATVIDTGYLESSVDGDISDRCEKLVFICGDRRGSLHMFSADSQKPFQSILGVHGKTGVTHVTAHHGYIYSTGRDGTFRKYKYNMADKQLQLIDKQKACKGMDWIEGIWFNNTDIIVYGFYMQSHFAAWSFEKNELLFKIKCGGGYRSWDVVFPNSDNHGMLGFAYVKGATLNLVSYNWRKTNHDRIIEDSLHGREVMAVRVLGQRLVNGSLQWLLATCSEDTTINFLIYDHVRRTLQCLHTAVGHIGGVKDVCFIPLSSSEDNMTIFKGFFISCGSRTSLKLWMLRDNLFHYKGDNNINKEFNFIDDKVNSSLDHEFSCSLTAEIYNPETTLKKLKLKDHSLIDDMRYMSCDAFRLSDIFPEVNKFGTVLCCVCACSDGVARIYTFNGHNIELLTSLDCDKHCALLVNIYTCHMNNTFRTFVFTAATNGCVAVWDITSLLDKYKDKLTQTSHVSNLDGIRVELSECKNAFAENNDNINNENMYESSSTLSCQMEENVEANKYTSHHVNEKKYKFHDLNTPLFSNAENCLKIHLHQSGVNAFAVQEITDGLMLVSGGDDSSLCLTKLLCNGYNLEVCGTSSKHGAHISSISAVRFVNESLLVSTSVDQRIKFWSLNNMEFLLIHQIRTDIADVSNMEIWISRGIVHVAVTGVGLEIFSISLEELTRFAGKVNAKE